MRPRELRRGRRAAALLLALSLAGLRAQGARAELPDAESLLRDIGFTADQIGQVEAGSFVPTDMKPSNERELVAAFAFLVQAPPGELVTSLRQGLVDRVDPNTLAFSTIEGTPGPASFAKLTLQPDAAQQAQAYLQAAPGGDLNLSAAEIASFRALGGSAGVPAVEGAVRSALLARLTAYQAQGLAGIAPYARSGGSTRAPADDLRSATLAAKRLQSLVPAAFQAMLEYPNAKPAGTLESFRWARYVAHGEPTISLTHSLYLPDGDAWAVMQRQFYVSTGYNCEQAIGGLLPMKQGTLVVYVNRTSTDQVTGFGGGMKRDIGSKLLASQLQAAQSEYQSALAACQAAVAPGLRDALTVAEQAWPPERDAQCNAEAEEYDDPRLQSYARTVCVAKATRERTRAMRAAHPECAPRP